MRREIELEARLDDRGADRIVAAAGAQGRYRSFVIAACIAERVGRQLRMMQSWLGDVGHADLKKNALTQRTQRSRKGREDTFASSATCASKRLFLVSRQRLFQWGEGDYGEHVGDRLDDESRGNRGAVVMQN